MNPPLFSIEQYHFQRRCVPRVEHWNLKHLQEERHEARVLADSMIPIRYNPD